MYRRLSNQRQFLQHTIKQGGIMHCYFCNYVAHGVCQSCGRFACRLHSKVENKKLVCFECKGSNMEELMEELYENARKELKQWYQQLNECAVCKSKVGQFFLVNIVGPELWRILNLDYRNKLGDEFPASFERCEYGCFLCGRHKPQRTQRSPYERRCPACNRTWVIESGPPDHW